MPLPPEDEIIQIATGRNQQVAITKEGKLIVWEVGYATEQILCGAFHYLYTVKPVNQETLVNKDTCIIHTLSYTWSQMVLYYIN